MQDDEDEDEGPVESPDWFLRSNGRVVLAFWLIAIAYAVAVAIDKALGLS